MAAALKMKDLQQVDVAGLKERVLELKRELLNLRFQKVSGQLKATHEVLRVRRSIAQIKTVLSMKAKPAGGKE